jgi:hypothetical protein
VKMGGGSKGGKVGGRASKGGKDKEGDGLKEGKRGVERGKASP